MKIRAVILAGGEGARLGVLTHKRTKPAVPFGGKYRIIDFALSNCVNSGITDVMMVAQYRPQSLIEHIGTGGPWDLDRDFTGGVRIYTPFKARRATAWFTGTADAVQQNFSFIKHGSPDNILVLSGDHIYAMDYEVMIDFHMDHQADLTMATIRVPRSEASRFGIVGVSPDYRVTSFVEKPKVPQSDLVNMGVYLFRREVLDQVLWEDHTRLDSTHDFGKDILPRMVASSLRVFAFPYSGYWVDVGTIQSYWQAHMDLLADPPALNLCNRDWIIHTRSEERPPVRMGAGARLEDCLLSDGCVIHGGARVVRSVLSPGVEIESGAEVIESIILTDARIRAGARVERAIIDKRAEIGAHTHVGSLQPAAGPSGTAEPVLTMIGKAAVIPSHYRVEAGASVGTDIIPADLPEGCVPSGQNIQTRRLPNEI
jgi:glucose-1-phosphate adenylyltransferase